MNLGQVYTKEAVANYMVGLFTLPTGAKVLDPCFGRGVFLDALIGKGLYEVDGVELDEENFSSCRDRESPDCHLYHVDFFSFDARGRYDGVVMNPPYVRQEEIDGLVDRYGLSKETLRGKAGGGLDGKANLYMYFTIQAFKALKEDGQMVVIFPNSWERNRSGRKFRQALSRLGRVEQHITVIGNPFQGEPIVDVEILKLRRGGGTIDTVYKEIRIEGDNIAERKIQEPALLQFENVIPLSCLAVVRRGKTTGCNRFFINPPVRSCVRDILSSPKDVTGFSTDNARIDKYLMLTSNSGTLPNEVQAYLRQCEDVILMMQWPKTLYRQVSRSEPWYVTAAMEPGHIVFPYIIRRSMRFIRNNRQLLARDNFYSIVSGVDTDLLMSLLNNYYVWYQLESVGKTYGNQMLKIQKYDVDNILVVNPDVIECSDKKELALLGGELASASAGTEDLISGITDRLEKYYAVKNIKSVLKDETNKRFGRHF